MWIEVIVRPVRLSDLSDMLVGSGMFVIGLKLIINVEKG
jgi:hypothetical protein